MFSGSILEIFGSSFKGFLFIGPWIRLWSLPPGVHSLNLKYFAWAIHFRYLIVHFSLSGYADDHPSLVISYDFLLFMCSYPTSDSLTYFSPFRDYFRNLPPALDNVFSPSLVLLREVYCYGLISKFIGGIYTEEYFSFWELLFEGERVLHQVMKSDLFPWVRTLSNLWWFLRGSVWWQFCSLLLINYIVFLVYHKQGHFLQGTADWFLVQVIFDGEYLQAK